MNKKAAARFATAAFLFADMGRSMQPARLILKVIQSDLAQARLRQVPASESSNVVHFLVYSRSYCHLCDDLLEALQGLSTEYAFTVEVLDVDADESLLAQFDELVPVLFGQRGEAAMVQLCNYFLDEQKVRAFLENAAKTD